MVRMAWEGSMLKALFAVALAGGLASTLTISGVQAAVPPAIVAQPAPTGVAVRPIAFTRLAFRMKSGERIGSASMYPMCFPSETSTWDGKDDGGDDGLDEETAKVFQVELSKAGFQAAGDADNLFEKANGSEAEFAVAGLVKAMNLKLCYPYLYTLYDDKRAKGEAQFTIEWQVYSRLKREVVGKVEVTSSSELKDSVIGGSMQLMRMAFADSVRGLINSEVFREAALAPPGASVAMGQPAPRADRQAIEFAKPTRKPAALSDAVGSVVTVLSGDGHGSGFLISDDGYVLTNQHVTAGAKYVKIRWSDKFESVGEVLREDKGRDVALIKTDSRGRTPLSLRRAAPEIGAEVYAVGAPLDLALQGTVTRGIVSSGTRVFDNYSYIQSDVTVNPGNSGGPLVTKDGDVLGLTVAGLRPEGAPTGINLFIPVGDALDFLALK
jgi:S1-C subfamily serine protease